MKKVMVLFATLIVATSCNLDLKDFYFKLENFSTPKYYKYECKANATRTQYWKISADVESNVLSTEAFDYEYTQFEIFKEKYESEGTRVIEYTQLNKKDTTKSNILNDQVFNWNGGNAFYEVEYEDQYGITKFSKKREYVGSENIEILGSEFLSIKFKGTYSFESVGTNNKLEFTQYSYYTKEHGFVKYERTQPNGAVVILELTQILSEQEWKALQ